MARNEEGEFELVLGNRQLLSGFFIVVVLFGVFCVYGLSGYAVYAWRKAKGLQTSVISTSTEEPEESGLHR